MDIIKPKFNLGDFVEQQLTAVVYGATLTGKRTGYIRNIEAFETVHDDKSVSVLYCYTVSNIMKSNVEASQCHDRDLTLLIPVVISEEPIKTYSYEGNQFKQIDDIKAGKCIGCYFEHNTADECYRFQEAIGLFNGCGKTGKVFVKVE